MAKVMCFLLCFGLLTSIYAQDTNRYFMDDEWHGEYPDGYVIVNNIELNLFTKPDNLVPIETTCVLSEGRYFHPNTIQNDEIYVTVSGSDIYETNRDFDDGEGHVYERGTEFVELMSLSEGYCYVETEGNVFMATCPHELGAFTLVSKSLIGSFRMIKTRCDNGIRGWIKEDDLLSRMNSDESEASVKPESEDEFYEKGRINFR